MRIDPGGTVVDEPICRNETAHSAQSNDWGISHSGSTT